MSNKAVYLKADRKLKRKYLKEVRRPFNLIYNSLMVGGPLFFYFMSYLYSNRGVESPDGLATIIYRIMFPTLLTIVWVGLWYYIRWRHRDYRIMYRNWDGLFLQSRGIRLMYDDLNKSETVCSERIRYSAIKEASLLTDAHSGLKVLQLKVSRVELRAQAISRDEDEASSGTDAYKVLLNTVRYIPLYYRNSEKIFERIKEKAGLEINEGQTVNIGTLKQEKLFEKSKKSETQS